MSTPYEPAIRATRAQIDLDALTGNVRAFRALVPGPVELIAVVKANGYGHGAVMTARTALASGATRLAVATVHEGVNLRSAGLAAPILVLGAIDPSEIGEALDHGLTLSVGDERQIELVGDCARRAGSGPAPIHLKIDTGMRRYGAMPHDVKEVARAIVNEPAVFLEGTFTHFACADEADERPTLRQAEMFERTLDELRTAEINPGITHAANSAATLRSRRYDYDAVRIGIAMYGLAPSPDVGLAPGMRPVMSIRSRVARTFKLRKGEGVSYGHAYVADGTETVALVPIGYADGYRRALSSHGRVSVRGRPAMVRGRVCMDQLVVGLPPGTTVEVGDEVVVADDGRGVAPSIDELADLLGTISYEIVTGIASRVPRVYSSGGAPVAIEDLTGLRFM